MNVPQDFESKVKHSVSLKTRVQNYFVSAVCIMLVMLLLLLSVTGVFSETDEDLQQIMEVQQQNTTARISMKLEELQKQGVEISGSRLPISEEDFRQCCPSVECRFGRIETLILPALSDEIKPSDGLVTDNLGQNDTLLVKEGKKFNEYSNSQEKYIGLQTKLTVEDCELYVVTLLPKAPIVQIKMQNALTWMLAFTAMFAGFILLSMYLSNQLVLPITNSLSILQSDDAVESLTRSGIREIDNLVNFIQSKPQQGVDGLPADIADLFDSFAQRAATLTPTERSIVRYYANGKEINEVAELAFISIHTVRKHNANIYQKLGIGSRDELMLYIELFRRCDRLNELC